MRPGGAGALNCLARTPGSAGDRPEAPRARLAAVPVGTSQSPSRVTGHTPRTEIRTGRAGPRPEGRPQGARVLPLSRRTDGLAKPHPSGKSQAGVSYPPAAPRANPEEPQPPRRFRNATSPSAPSLRPGRADGTAPGRRRRRGHRHPAADLSATPRPPTRGKLQTRAVGEVRARPPPPPPQGPVAPQAPNPPLGPESRPQPRR